MKAELWESFPARRHGAMRGMRADGESGEQQQQRRGKRRGGCAARQEPAAYLQEAAGGQLPWRRKDVGWHEEGGLLLTHAVPLQGGLHQQHHLPHVRLQGAWDGGRPHSWRAEGLLRSESRCPSC